MKRKTCFVNYITQRIPSVTGVVLELISYTLFLRTHSQLTVWLSTDVKIWWNKCRNLNIYYCAKSLVWGSISSTIIFWSNLQCHVESIWHDAVMSAYFSTWHWSQTQHSWKNTHSRVWTVLPEPPYSHSEAGDFSHTTSLNHPLLPLFLINTCNHCRIIRVFL